MINKVDLGSTDKFLAAIGNYYRVFQVVLRGAQIKTRTESQKLQGRFTDLQELPAQENLVFQNFKTQLIIFFML